MPASIKLTQGRVCLVDEADAEWLRLYCWGFNNGYAARSTWDKEKLATGKRIYMHRLLCPGGEVDHIDGNRLNNQRVNLRIVTSGANKQNQAARNQFKLKGVQANRHRFQAILWHEGERKCLGTYDDALDAARAYDAAALQHYGPGARINGV